MSKLPNSLASYGDVHQVLKLASERGELELTFDSKSEATTFAARAHKYRVLLRQGSAEKGGANVSPFDHLTISRARGSGTIFIKPRGFNFKVREVQSGEELSINPATPVEDFAKVIANPVIEDDRPFISFLDEFEKGLKDGD